MRLLSAGIVISLLSLLAWLDFSWNFGNPGIWLAPLLVAGALLACGECLDLLYHAGHRPLKAATVLGVAAIVVGACVPAYWGLFGPSYPPDCPLGKLGWPMLGLAFGAGAAFTGEMRRFDKPGGAIVHVALAVFVMAYVGVLLAFLAPLRLFHDNGWGMTALLSLIMIVKGGDSGAYLVGRLFGKHKLAPKLSPGKTVEGVVGGLLFAGAVSWATFEFLAPALTGEVSVTAPWAALAYGMLLGGMGVIADLAESLFKRDVDRKDSSGWLPGLGGVLDILDSLLFTAPTAYLCWAAGLVGPLS